MADIGEAFSPIKHQIKQYTSIDYFFTQRALIEDREFIDKKTMTRKTKKIKITHNFLALSIPTVITDNITIDMMQNMHNKQTGTTTDFQEKPLGFDIEIYGDEGYDYKGTISSHEGIIPNFMIPIKNDKKIFIKIEYKYVGQNGEIFIKKYKNFVDVPKRFQTGDSVEEDIFCNGEETAQTSGLTTPKQNVQNVMPTISSNLISKLEEISKDENKETKVTRKKKT